jgi:hypothetical protein
VGEQLKANTEIVVWLEFQEESGRGKPDEDKDGAPMKQ